MFQMKSQIMMAAAYDGGSCSLQIMRKDDVCCAANRYEGEWRNGLENGVGTFIGADGATFYGPWSGGKMHGQIVSPFLEASSICLFIEDIGESLKASHWYLYLAFSNLQQTQQCDVHASCPDRISSP